jgi:hypothetical protein
MQMMLRDRGAVIALILPLIGASAAANEVTINKSADVRVGETGQLIVTGGHKSECVTSTQAEIRIVRPPRIGTLGQRYNVPYAFETSLSGKCIGAYLTGTAIDYTGNSRGKDSFQFDSIFPNGTAHFNISVEVR